ncbi:MAG TPA: hypothetical protein VG603_01625 [Chitinophagales bacterium]|nr:hypothetical protein [Chitinophagales bacterium]
MGLFNKIWIGCKQATFLHEKKREGKLAFPDRLGLFIHLLYCSFCRLFVRQSEMLEKHTHTLGENESRYQLSTEKKALLQKLVESETRS